LSAAAKAVAGATQSLVMAAKSATQAVQEAEAKPNWEEPTSQTLQRKVEMEKQVSIVSISFDCYNNCKPSLNI
jgi:hypothetical protein